MENVDHAYDLATVDGQMAQLDEAARQISGAVTNETVTREQIRAAARLLAPFDGLDLPGRVDPAGLVVEYGVRDLFATLSERAEAYVDRMSA